LEILNHRKCSVKSERKTTRHKVDEKGEREQSGIRGEKSKGENFASHAGEWGGE